MRIKFWRILHGALEGAANMVYLSKVAPHARKEEWKSAEDEYVQIIVVPEDGNCEGCGEPLGDEVFETDDMVVVCRGCHDLCISEALSDGKAS